jgi:hypothetical protein
MLNEAHNAQRSSQLFAGFVPFIAGAILGSGVAISWLVARPIDDVGEQEVEDKRARTGEPGVAPAVKPSIAPDPRGRCADLQEQLRGLQGRLHALERGAERSKTRDDEAKARPVVTNPRCTPVPWPEDIAAIYGEAELRSVLAELLTDHDFLLDCAEFPCLATIEDREGRPIDFAALQRRLPSDTEFIRLSTAGPGLDGPRHTIFLAPLPTNKVDPDLRERVDGRMNAWERDREREAYEAMGRPPGSW